MSVGSKRDRQEYLVRALDLVQLNEVVEHQSPLSAEDQIEPTCTRKVDTDSTDMHLLRLPRPPTNLLDNCTAPDAMHQTCRQSLPSSL